MLSLLLLLHFSTCVCLLPSPAGVYLESIDMTHVLKWRPLQATCNTTVLYSVQFQGEFERSIMNGTWLDAPECQKILLTRCDLTSDLGSDSDYDIRVRAQCESQVSTWTSISPPFNRRDTFLTMPEVTVTVDGYALKVSFNQLPLTVTVSVTVWKRGDEKKAVVYKIPAEQKVLNVAALQEGAEYCITAQKVYSTKFSERSPEQCVPIIGPDAAWKRPTTVSVTVVVMAGLLFVVFWSVVHCHAHACHKFFQKKPLPSVLEDDRPIQTPIHHEVEERCDLINEVLKPEPEPAQYGYMSQ